jgi:hypothetical protein
MPFGGGKLGWSLIQNEGEIVTVLELQQHRVSLFWTSDRAKGEQVGDCRKPLTAKGAKGTAKGAKETLAAYRIGRQDRFADRL